MWMCFHITLSKQFLDVTVDILSKTKKKKNSLDVSQVAFDNLCCQGGLEQTLSVWLVSQD